METSHLYLPSIDYINELSFDYMETWSFQRGIGFERDSQATEFLINEAGQLHPSGQKLNTFQSTDPIAGRLMDILKTAIQEVPAWMCGPIYRDAIVFYSKTGHVISVLNVCLSCERMQTGAFTHIDTDAKVYTLLNEFFVSIGHPVEE